MAKRAKIPKLLKLPLPGRRAFWVGIKRSSKCGHKKDKLADFTWVQGEPVGVIRLSRDRTRKQKIRDFEHEFDHMIVEWKDWFFRSLRGKW